MAGKAPGKKKRKPAKSKGTKGTAKPLEPAAEWADPKSLKPWPKNPREYADAAIDETVRSITELGFGSPIVARRSNREIIAGHRRHKASLKMSLPQVPVRFLDISARKAHLLALADNRHNEKTEWVIEGLTEVLGDFSVDEKELAGWSERDLAKLEGGGSETNEDEAPEPPDKPVTKLGDLWRLGRHRLLCGDSKVEANVQRVMDGNRATCLFTDPPYGVSVAAKNRTLNTVQKSGRCLEDIVDDDLSPADLKAALTPAFVNARTIIMAADCSVFVTAPQGGELSMMMMMQEAGLRVRHVLIWKKNAPTFSMGRLDYDYQHEPILLTWLKRHKRPMLGNHKTSIWEIDKPRASPKHPTTKPVELYTNAYLNNSGKGDNVADIYAGSGPAFSAAEQTERVCHGLEISPAYCDVIVERWETLSGGKATRARR